MNNTDTLVGDEALLNRGKYKIRYAMRNGMVMDWDDLERVWLHAFSNELVIQQEDHPVLLTDAPLNTKSSRERMTEIMFDNFNVPALFVATNALMSLFAVGKNNGIVEESGEGVTHTVPVYEGVSLPHAIGRMNLGGIDISNNLMKILGEKGYEVTFVEYERKVVEHMKIKLGYFALDYENELKKAESTKDCEGEYVLNDGSKITINNERFKSTEIMFKPSLVGSETRGIHETLLLSIEKCDKDLWRDLYPNIVLSGGNTLFKGLKNRLENEIKKLFPKKIKEIETEVTAHMQRDFTSWIGGSLLSNMSYFRNIWIIKDEYDDVGATIVHRKCF